MTADYAAVRFVAKGWAAAVGFGTCTLLPARRAIR